MTEDFLLSFRKDILLVEVSAERVMLESPRGKMTLSNLKPGLLAALRMLSSGGATKGDLSELVPQSEGAFGLGLLYYYVHRWSKLGLLCYSVAVDGRCLATLEPMTRCVELPPQAIPARASFQFSRFAYCRRDGEALVLESPLCPARTILPERIGAVLVAELARPRTCADLCSSVDGLTADAAQAFLSLLASAAVVAEVGRDGTLAEEANPTLVQWEFHDLLFHSRSRLGMHDSAIGASYRFLGTISPLPALKPKMSDAAIPLYKPDGEQLNEQDTPFIRVMENRRSIRAYGNEPITAQHLGEFLYRVARVRQIIAPDPAGELHYQASDRPYPGGGAIYELELYVTVNTCSGIPTGLYHYDPLEHQLRRLAEHNEHVELLLRDAQLAAPLSSEPQVLITLASRFQRLSWKYSGVAYATTLKNVGVLYQSMYLVATAMGLAPCALGAGNAALFAEAVGTDYFAESSVGEFLLGSQAAPPRPPSVA